MTARPIPVPNAHSWPFWVAAGKGELRLPQCSRCGVIFYPPPPRCRHCLDSALDWTRLSGRGRLVAWSTIHLPTIPGVAPPFTLAEVELVEQPGLIVSALLVGSSNDELTIGRTVEMTFTEANSAGVAYPQFHLHAEAHR